MKSSRNWLDEERRTAADLIRAAGNKAIHEPDLFKKLYAKQMPEIIDNLRKVVIDLYAESVD